MKIYRRIMGLGLACLLSGNVSAALLGVNPGYPQINYGNSDPNSITYDPGTHIFSANSAPFGIVLSGADSGSLITNGSLQIQFATTDGVSISGTNGFTVTGQFTRVDGGVTNTYSGTLLQGDVTAFGFLDSAFSDQYDFRIHLTGGALMPQFSCGDDLAVTLISESSTFDGDFTVAFNGTSEGIVGSEDLTPPTVTCPLASQVVTTPATNGGVSGFIVTYPDPVVTDNCDPTPTVFADTPSGTFLPLNPGDTITITIYGIDVSGNFNFCSFDAVMQQGTGPCPPAFNDSGCGLITLTNDPDKCAATYTFSAPVATNCSGQTFVATATAVDQSSAVVPLSNLGNGVFRGSFPRTTTGSNVITFAANDGNGNAVMRQCFVTVVDDEAPTLLCKNQTATFKPIMTNAVSCIQATFNDIPIAASNYVWFTSAMQAPGNGSGSFTLHVFDQTIDVSVDNTNLVLNVPESYVVFSNGVVTATTSFTNGKWITVNKPGPSGSTFISGLPWQVPFDLNSHFGNIRHRVNSVTWCARFAVDTPGIVIEWEWSAAVYYTFSSDLNSLGVKPVDNNNASLYRNSDHAGAPENFKPYLIGGARGGGGGNWTGSQSGTKRANLGVGTVCEGPVNFLTPMAVDNCDDFVTVTCVPPSGSTFGPGDHTINCTAVDSSCNSNSCSFTLTVLAPLQVVFDSPSDDNINDNTAQPDSGFTDMNCPDDPATPEIVTRFTVGDKISHTVRLLDCSGNDVTSQLAPFCTVHFSVTERQGTYYDSILVKDLTQSAGGVGTPGALMVPNGNAFQYILDTQGFEAATINNSKFFRCCVWVDYNSSPGVPVGMEDVVLESK